MEFVGVDYVEWKRGRGKESDSEGIGEKEE